MATCTSPHRVETESPVKVPETAAAAGVLGAAVGGTVVAGAGVVAVVPVGVDDDGPVVVLVGDGAVAEAFGVPTGVGVPRAIDEVELRLVW